MENRTGTPAVGPRKETARIGVKPATETPMKATVKLSSVQPPSGPTIPVIRSAPAALAKPPQPAAPSLGDTIPTQFYWALLAVSALALLIQLWIYFS